MYKFGRKSLERLSKADPRLVEIMNELIKVMDVSILDTYRDKDAQDAAYKAGFSKLKFPQSKHNVLPSLAVDVVPYPIDWNDLDRFKRMCGIIEGIAATKGIKIRLGRDFSFKDYPHIELL